MNKLVTREAFIKATNLERFKLGAAAGPLMRLTGITKFNRLYDELHSLKGMAFIDEFMRMMQVTIEVEGKGLDRIPKDGAFIAVSNHPYGMWDGLIMLKLLGEKRADFRVMAHFLLQQIPQVQDLMIPLNASEQEIFLNIQGLRQTKRHLKEGHPMGIFPAGEVSTFHRRDRGVTDRAWKKDAIKLMASAEVPIIPVYFEGGNSAIFHLMGLIHPTLRMATIPSETLRMRQTVIKVKIGSPISVKEQKSLGSADRFGRYLRARVYALGSGLEVQAFFRKRFSFPTKHKEIAAERDKGLIAKEVESLRQDNGLICSQAEFDIFVAKASAIPNGLQEIGRRRELTFRQVGEGTGHDRDLDEYDLYYRHLFLWDREAEEIVGAYRMGPGDEIMMKYGKRGFYTFSLFRMQKGLTPLLAQSVELGRSFILPEYQRKRLPLFLLWKGIRQYLLRHPQYRYLIGPVSISNDYSKVSKSFMVAYIQHFFFDQELAKHIKPRKRFHPNLGKIDIGGLLEGVSEDIKMADKLVEELEPRHARLPVLLKKYIKQNARIICFNVDPKFMNALDGFMVLDIQNLPSESEEIYG